MDDAEKLLPLYPFMFQLPDGNVFFAGSGQLTYVLDIDAESWLVDSINAFNEALDGTSVMYEPGKILRISGTTNGGTDNTIKSIDMTGAPPSAWSSAPSLGVGRKDLVSVVLADGTVLVVGGVNDSIGNVLEPELYDPSTLPIGSWSNLAPKSFPRSYHSTALLLPSGKVFTSGGDDCGNSPSDVECADGTLCTAEIFSPPYMFAGDAPVVGYAPSSINYILDFVVALSTSSPIDTSEIDKISLVRLGSVTHSFDQNQRYVPLNFNVIDNLRLT